MRARLPLLIAGLVLTLAACGPAAEAPAPEAPAPAQEPAPAAPDPASTAPDAGNPEEAAPAVVPPPVAFDPQVEPKAQAGCLDEIATVTNTDRAALIVTDVATAESGISVYVHVPGADGRWFCLANADGSLQGTEFRGDEGAL